MNKRYCRISLDIRIKIGGAAAIKCGGTLCIIGNQEEKETR